MGEFAVGVFVLMKVPVKFIVAGALDASLLR
jgi:hypothetical protein